MLSDKNENLNSKSAFLRADLALSGPRSGLAAAALLPVLTWTREEHTRLPGLWEGLPKQVDGKQQFLSDLLQFGKPSQKQKGIFHDCFWQMPIKLDAVYSNQLLRIYFTCRQHMQLQSWTES